MGAVVDGFNTQPPEGGWHKSKRTTSSARWRFNTQPPEGGWTLILGNLQIYLIVSTHSRPKAAGNWRGEIDTIYRVSTHSRPKAAGFVR